MKRPEAVKTPHMKIQLLLVWCFSWDFNIARFTLTLFLKNIYFH